MIDLFAAVLRGERPSPDRLQGLHPAEVVRLAEEQGVVSLVAEALDVDGVPESLRRQLKARAGRLAGADLVREAELTRLIDALAQTGVDALIIKGAALAQTHYDRPDLRPRFDTDLLVEERQRAAAEGQLQRLGYEPIHQTSGDLIMYQASWALRRSGAPVHVVDLHWRLTNPQAFSEVLTFEELAASAIALPRLGPHARGPDPVQALLIACVHRVAHHFDAAVLIWEYDIHLVASRLTDPEWRRFVALAASRHVAAVCRRGLDLAVARFGTAVPAWAWPEATATEPRETMTAAFLGRRRHVEAVAGDLRALPTWRARWRLLRQHLFPPATYMRDVYAPASQAPLAVLYVRRAMKGARKWLARS